MRGFKDLEVYQLSYKLAMEIFEVSKTFPKEERYSLTDQIHRASRAVCSNIAEGYRKRIYPNHFKSKMSDADAEASETMVWLDFARDCKYLSKDIHSHLYAKYERVGKMLGKMIKNPKNFYQGSNHIK